MKKLNISFPVFRQAFLVSIPFHVWTNEKIQVMHITISPQIKTAIQFHFHIVRMEGNSTHLIYTHKNIKRTTKWRWSLWCICIWLELQEMISIFIEGMLGIDLNYLDKNYFEQQIWKIYAADLDLLFSDIFDFANTLQIFVPHFTFEFPLLVFT